MCYKSHNIRLIDLNLILRRLRRLLHLAPSAAAALALPGGVVGGRRAGAGGAEAQLPQPVVSTVLASEAKCPSRSLFRCRVTLGGQRLL